MFGRLKFWHWRLSTSGTPPAPTFRLKPVDCKVLVALRGEFRLVKGKEIDAETLEYKDPLTKKRMSVYVGTPPTILSGLKFRKRFRVHYVRWGIPITVSPYDGGCATDLEPMLKKLKDWGWNWNDKGEIIQSPYPELNELFAGKPFQTFKMIDGKPNAVHTWKVYDVSELDMIKADEASKVRHDSYMALGKAMKERFISARDLAIILALIVPFIFAILYVWIVTEGFT